MKLRRKHTGNDFNFERTGPPYSKVSPISRCEIAVLALCCRVSTVRTFRTNADELNRSPECNLKTHVHVRLAIKLEPLSFASFTNHIGVSRVDASNITVHLCFVGNLISLRLKLREWRVLLFKRKKFNITFLLFFFHLFVLAQLLFGISFYESVLTFCTPKLNSS